MRYFIVCLAFVAIASMPSPASAFWEECQQLYLIDTNTGASVPVGQPFNCEIPPEAWAAMGATVVVAGVLTFWAWSDGGYNVALTALEDGLREFNEHVEVTHHEGETKVRWSYNIAF